MAKERKICYGIFACNYKCIVALFVSSIFLGMFLCLFPKLYNLIRGNAIGIILTCFACICVFLMTLAVLFVLLKEKQNACEETFTKKKVLLRGGITLLTIVLLLTITTAFLARKLNADGSSALTAIQFAVISVSVFSMIETIDKTGIKAFLNVVWNVFVGVGLLFPLAFLMRRLEPIMNDYLKVLTTAVLWTISYYLSKVLSGVFGIIEPKKWGMEK